MAVSRRASRRRAAPSLPPPWHLCLSPPSSVKATRALWPRAGSGAALATSTHSPTLRGAGQRKPGLSEEESGLGWLVFFFCFFKERRLQMAVEVLYPR